MSYISRRIKKKEGIPIQRDYFTLMMKSAKYFDWKEQVADEFDTCIYESIEFLKYEHHGEYCFRLNHTLDLTNCNEKYIFFDMNQNIKYYKNLGTNSYISRSNAGMLSYEVIKVHWISQKLLQTSILRYLLWYYKVKQPEKSHIIYEDKTRQTSIYEFMVPQQRRESPKQYDRLWSKGLDIFAQKDYLTNEQEEIQALKDIEISDDWDDWRFDELCFWNFNFGENLYGHDLDCYDIQWHDFTNEDDYTDEDDAIKRCNKEYKNIVDDFIEVSHQPYEKFELGIFCWNRENECYRDFYRIAKKEYDKLIKEFTQFRCAQLKDELLAVIYHPDRIMKLLTKGYTQNEITNCYS